MFRYSISFWLLCGLAALPAAAGAGLQEDADASAKFKQGVDTLRQIAQQDATARRYSPEIESMLKHVYLDDLVATTSEQKVAQALTPGTGDTTEPIRPVDPSHSGKHLTVTPRGLNFQIAELKEVLNSLLQTASKAVYTSGTRRTPMGRQIGYVKMIVGSRSDNLVDVPVGSGRATVVARAAVIRARMNALRIADPLWWTRLSVTQKNHQYVVATPAAADGYIITADEKFAHLRNRTPQQLAQDLVASIRAAYDPAPTALTARDLDMNELHRQAVQAWEAGNEAYNRKDMTGAEAAYLKAIAMEPNYVVAYESLGGLYAEEKKTDQAREQFQKALTCDGIHPEQKTEIQQMLNALK